MRIPLLLSFLLLGLVFLPGCQSTQKAADASSPVVVSWKLISNFTEVPAGFKAKFVLRNEGQKALENKGWTLYFNMSPRPIRKTDGPATVEHINGDWYKLTPNASFSLKPGETIEIPYEGTEGVIKETDAPLGLYIVYAENGSERIEEISNYTIEPFTKQEQILRGKDDQLPIPSPELAYQQNHDLTLLPADQVAPIVPVPLSLAKGGGSLPLSSSLTIYAQKGLEKEAELLADRLKSATGTVFSVSSGAGQGKGIFLQLGAVGNTKTEAYRLTVDANGVRITGSDPAGVFYGTQSLVSLLPVSSFAKPAATLDVPFVQVEDAPRFAFRGLHLDVSRNFQTKESVLRVIDLLAFYKINRLLFYTTEDEGWRLEIDGLPELTEVGAHREHTAGMHTPVLHPSYGSGPFAHQEGKYGSGFYTKKDFVEILQYAAARHVKIIPELNFPGHARAAIKSMEARYERLMKEGKKDAAEEYRLIDPQDKSVYLSAQGYKDNVVCVARESVYRFYEKVVDEITKMYQEAGLKMDVIHAGGDEVADGAWTKSPMIDDLLRKHPEIKGPRYLQSYFFGQLQQRLRKRNLEVHGWEEVAMNKTPDGRYQANPAFVGQGVVPYIWNNLYDPDLGYRLANAGYPVILCNVTNFYFDLAYSNDPKEPGLYWGGFVGPRNAWTFAPFDYFKTTYTNSMGKPLDLSKMERLKPGARRNILGVEAELWSETVKGRDMMEYYMLPKLMAFAESAWSPARNWETIEQTADREKAIRQGWNAFANGLAQREMPRLKHLNGGYHYRVPMPGVLTTPQGLKANAEYPGLTIRYTTDNTEPTSQSPIYKEPITKTGTIRLRCFDASGTPGRTVTVTR